MSKFKVMAVAVAAALAAPAAFATTVNVGTTNAPGPAVLPLNAFVDATTVATTAARQVAVVANATTVYLGRTTGYNVRLTLSQGVFSSTPSAAVAVTGRGTVAVAGGGANANTVTYAVTPAANGVVEGDGIVFAAGNIAVRDVAALGSGGSINVLVQVFDPVGGNQLGTDINATLINTVEGWVVTFTPGAASQRVDVGATSGKRFFGNETVGSGLAATRFVAGTINVALEPTLTSPMTLSLANATAPVVIRGTDFAAFAANTTNTAGGPGRIFLASSATCAATGTQIGAAVASDRQSAAIPATTTAAAVNTNNTVCFDSDNVTAIAAQPISASVTVAQTGTNAAPNAAGNLRAIAYNGTVVHVDHFNPASNAQQQSYLRVINPSGTPGLVTVEAVCESGIAASGTASFTLAQGASRQVNSANLENGGNGVAGGLGSCGGGKSRLTVTGEFANMRVQNFLRNEGPVTNTNINNQN